MGFTPDRLEKVAFIYATFPRCTETFVRRELRAMHEVGFNPKLFSIWKGKKKWEGYEIQKFNILKLWTLFFWLPYWAFKNQNLFVKFCHHYGVNLVQIYKIGTKHFLGLDLHL